MQVLAKSSSTCFALSSSVNRDDSRRNVLMRVFKSYDKINMINCTQVFSGGIYRLSVQMTILESTDKLQECELFPTSLKMYEEFGCQTWGEKQMKQTKKTTTILQKFFFPVLFLCQFSFVPKTFKKHFKENLEHFKETLQEIVLSVTEIFIFSKDHSLKCYKLNNVTSVGNTFQFFTSCIKVIFNDDCI